MTASYDMPVRTNHDAWRAVYEGVNDGLTLLEISGRAGISYRMVIVYRKMSRPAKTLRKLQRTHFGANRCLDCGAAAAHSGSTYAGRCRRCAMALHSSVRSGRAEHLRSWALRNGRVPTVNEARVILGTSRSIAGDEVLAAFGPDHRDGGQRRKAYRGWPQGAPDVPNAAGLAELRGEGRHMAATRSENPTGSRA